MCLAAAVACGHAEPVPPAGGLDVRAAETAGAVTALRDGRFEEAAHEASRVLARAPRSSQAAAVRAIAAYEQAGDQLIGELKSVEDVASHLSVLDEARGRAAWQSFVEQLDAVDRDLAIVADDPGFALELCLACWDRDWNHDGKLDERDRKLFEIEYDEHGDELRPDDPRRRPTFRFDRGDADWARAMVAFQRAFAELVLAYRWAELDQLFANFFGDKHITIHLAEPRRVQRARQLVLAGLDYADRCRAEYLAETDDDREWVPNPRQHSHPVLLPVDDALYQRWGAITRDVRRLVTGQDGLSLRELAAAVDPRSAEELPDAYIDISRMLSEPVDIVLDNSHDRAPDAAEHVLRGLLGHGYVDRMRASPLVARLRHIHDELVHGDDRLDRKLRYLLWLN
jgi:hypothetical protein